MTDSIDDAADGRGVGLTIVVPWTPDKRANPNDHSVSERTRIRHRKKGADAAALPMRQVRINSVDTPVINGEAVVDVLVRWPKGRGTWDRDNLITALKYVCDQLEREGIIENDALLSFGSIDQERATGQPETVLTIWAADAKEVAA